MTLRFKHLAFVASFGVLLAMLLLGGLWPFLGMGQFLAVALAVWEEPS